MFFTDLLVFGAFVILLPVIIWGILNEEQLVEFENKAIKKIKKGWSR